MKISRFNLVMALVFSVACARVNAADISFTEALRIIETLEKKTSHARWRFEFRESTPDITDPRQFTPGIRFCKGSIVYDFVSGKYRCDMDLVTRWSGGVAPFVAYVNIFSSDGITERSYQQSKPGTELPGATDRMGGGEINRPEADKFLGNWANETGIGHVTPLFWDKRLSAFLRESAARKPVTVSEIVQGVWRITANDRENPDMEKAITYDLNKGGLVTHVSVLSKGHLSDESIVEAEQNGDGYWFPKTIYHVGVSPIQRIVISSFVANGPIAESEYTLRFRKGTNVVNTIENEQYIMGGGPESDTRDVKEFILKEGLIYRGDSQETRKYWWIIMLISAPAVFALAFWVWRRWRMRIAIIAAAIGFMPLARADSQSAPQGTENDQEIVNRSNCGLNVTVFALEYYQKTYDARALHRALAVGKDPKGVLLSDIQDILRAHGLTVDARKKVGIADLQKAVRLDQIAIFPIKVTPRVNHFISAALHAEKGFVVVDPPYSATPPDAERLDQLLNDCGGLALFITPRSRVLENQSEFVSASPKEFDFGTVSASDPAVQKALVLNLKLKNRADAPPVFVRNLSFPCGCISTEWAPGLIRSGEEVTIPIKIDRPSWGPGNSKSFSIQFADDSEFRFVIRGKSIMPDLTNGLQVLPGSHSVEVVDSNSQDTISVRSVVRVDSHDIRHLSISSKCPWLRLKVDYKSDAEADVIVLIDKRVALPDGAGMALGEISIASVTPERQRTIAVHVYRQSPFAVSEAFVQMKKGGRAPTIVVSGGNGSAPRFVKGQSEPAGITLTSDTVGRQLRIQPSFQNGAGSGYYVVRADVTDGRITSTVSFVVQVGD